MTLTPDQAAGALADIAQSESKTRELAGYQNGARHFFIWGAIWVVGYGATGLNPAYAPIWMPLVALGWLATLTMGVRTPRARGINRKVGLSALVAAVFTLAVFAVLRPAGNEISAFPPLLLAGAYCIAGLWALPRYVFIGIALFVLTLAGFFLLAPWFSFWMADVGGGALLLSGLWLKRA